MAIVTRDRIEGQTKRQKKDVNNITFQELKEVPFMTFQRARLIVDYREAFGPFKRIQDVKEVPGIGDGLMKLVEQYLEVLPTKE
jgi:competence protein ComEA